MRSPSRPGLAVAVATLLLAAACSSGKSSTTTEAGGATSSAPAATSPVPTSPVPTAPTTPPTTVKPLPAVASAGGWQLTVTAPTLGTTIGPMFDLCYQLTGPGPADVAFDVSLENAATASLASSGRFPATIGKGSVRADMGNPPIRNYNLVVQTVVNGQPLDMVAVTIGVLFGSTPPAGCP